jgi:hypothetical protein
MDPRGFPCRVSSMLNLDMPRTVPQASVVPEPKSGSPRVRGPVEYRLRMQM